jgi:hypothetical protein
VLPPRRARDVDDARAVADGFAEPRADPQWPSRAAEPRRRGYQIDDVVVAFRRGRVARPSAVAVAAVVVLLVQRVRVEAAAASVPIVQRVGDEPAARRGGGHRASAAAAGVA